jgi:hypothetical protein
MSRIFVSHSSLDKDVVGFFSQIAAGTQVQLIFEEFEKITSARVDAAKIRVDVANSNAVFLILSSKVQLLPHTRDWIAAEGGLAAGKDLWVFEPFKEQGRVSVVTPFLRHYVVFHQNDSFFQYIHRIVTSYDDSQVLPTLLLTTSLGAILGKGPGAALGALSGLAIADRSSSRPTGLEAHCSQCNSVYCLHLPIGSPAFRCPVCNTWLACPQVTGALPRNPHLQLTATAQSWSQRRLEM